MAFPVVHTTSNKRVITLDGSLCTRWLNGPRATVRLTTVVAESTRGRGPVNRPPDLTPPSTRTPSCLAPVC